MQNQEATNRVYALELFTKLRLQVWKAEGKEITNQLRVDSNKWISNSALPYGPPALSKLAIDNLLARKNELADWIAEAETVLKQCGL